MTYKLPMKADGSVDLDELGTEFIYMSFDVGFVEVLKILVDHAKAEELKAISKMRIPDSDLGDCEVWMRDHARAYCAGNDRGIAEFRRAIRIRGQLDD